MKTVRDLCVYLENEYYWRMLAHKCVNNVSYGMFVSNGKPDDEKIRQSIIKNCEYNKLYILRQCMTLISMSMIERGEY